MKHTKGPWRIGYEDQSGPEYITANNKPLVTLRWGCSCCKECIDKFEDMTKEEQANARLIAAAPELLEACKAIDLNAIWDGKRGSKGYLVMEHHIERARQAIAKAEGE